MSHDEELIGVFRCHHFKGSLRISLAECFGTTYVGFSCIPFKLSSIELSVALLKEVDLALLLRSPEPKIGKWLMDIEMFESFRYGKVLPQSSGVGAVLHLLEVCNDGIAYTQIPEIDLPARFELVSQIA